jgi:hypothetical protein
MHRTVVAFLLTVVLTLAACSPGGGGTPGQPGDPAAGPEDSGEEVETVQISPEAELEGQCEPLPQTDEDGQFVGADLVVRNTGDIGVIVRVVATWRQPGGQYLTTSQRLRLDLDESAPVSLRIDIGKAEARAIRRMVQRERPCYVRVRVAGAFGAPRQ